MKTCLECDDKIIGREDKKFCSDACRNAFNNKINKDSNNFMRKINNRLRRNYRILSEINPSGKTTIARNKLTDMGFDFEYFTSMQNAGNEKTLYFLYDQGYRVLDNENFLVVFQNTQ